MKIKTYLLFPIILLCFSHLNAQTVDGKQISELDTEYVILYEFRCLRNNVWSAKVDYGQKVLSYKESWIRDSDDRPYKFNSIVHLLNTFSKSGYEVLETFTEDGDDEFSKILLRKI